MTEAHAELSSASTRGVQPQLRSDLPATAGFGLTPIVAHAHIRRVPNFHSTYAWMMQEGYEDESVEKTRIQLMQNMASA